MKLSYNWLKDFVEIKETPEKIAELLSLHVAEVEKLEEIGSDKIVIGQVLEVKKHPQADRLSLTKVDVGKKILNIVCGAANVKAGIKVPVALIGTILPNGLKIEKRKIRGQISEGMICSEIELGLGEEATGIMVLPETNKVGSSFFGEKDYIFNIDNHSLTHRPDLFSHWGFARELAIVLNKPLASCLSAPTKSRLEAISPAAFRVKIEAKKLCPRYMAVILDGLQIGPSPSWMQQRLQACGLRPINNVVDITNYVMLEIGESLHAFDYQKCKMQNAKCKIIVRQAKRGEKIKALDGKEYNLDKTMLVIADEEKPIALAGVIGGEETAVSEQTKTIIIESANFEPIGIRKTSQKLGLRTESSLRFEKGLSKDFPEWGILRCIELMEKYARAKVISKIFDLGKKEEKKKVVLEKIKIDKRAKKILESLGFKVQGKKVIVPSWRTDITIEEDVFEEISRIHGYNRIIPEPLINALKPLKENPYLYWVREIRNILVGLGFTEVYNYSFAPTGKIALKNPIAPELKYLRTSLKEKLLIERTFEIGHIFLPEEKRYLAFFCEDYFEAKGVLEFLRKKLNIKKEIGHLDDRGRAEIDLDELSKLANYNFRYQTIPKYPPVMIDLAMALNKEIKWGDFVKEVKHPYLVNIELFDVYEKLPYQQKSFAMHLTFQKEDRTLTMDEVEGFREEIVSHLNKKFKAVIRDKNYG